VPRLNIRRPQPPLSAAASASPPAAAAGDRPVRTREKLPPDARAAREAIAARLALPSPLRQPSPGPPHQRERQIFGEDYEEDKEKDYEQGGEDERFDFAVEPPSMDGSMDGSMDAPPEPAAATMPAAPALPALGVKFFRELLTPRLSEEELSRRVSMSRRAPGFHTPTVLTALACACACTHSVLFNARALPCSPFRCAERSACCAS
jgi:hypothetical protein